MFHIVSYKISVTDIILSENVFDTSLCHIFVYGVCKYINDEHIPFINTS